MAQYCVRCGTALEERQAFGRSRLVCSACGYVHFDDPKVAVGVVAVREGRILLTKRNHEPKMGCWSFPSGFVDAYEDVRAAAVRETFEETGITVEVGALLGVFQEPGSRVIYLSFAAAAGPGEPVISDECMDVQFFPADALPELAFSHDAAIVDAWRRLSHR